MTLLLLFNQPVVYNLAATGISASPTVGTPALGARTVLSAGGGVRRGGSSRGLVRRIGIDNVWLYDANDLDIPRPTLGTPSLGRLAHHLAAQPLVLKSPAIGKARIEDKDIEEIILILALAA